MGFLDDNQLASLKLERITFHVVGPDDTDFTLLNELNPGPHGGFFVERVRATNGGNRFVFIESSGTEASLRRILDDPARFDPESRYLAKKFQKGHAGNMGKGVFLLLLLSAGRDTFFSMIKYDHETVLHYEVEQGNAVLEQIKNTFVRSPDALQKSALIRLSETGGEVCVVDRSNRSHISNYFQAFLEVEREFTSEQLTQRLVVAANETATKHTDDLADHVRKNLRVRIYDAVQGQKSFSASDPLPFLTAVFGPLPPDAEIAQTFTRELRRQRIEEESFALAAEAMQRPPRRRTVTLLAWQHSVDS
jgi:hypothetical protein